MVGAGLAAPGAGHAQPEVGVGVRAVDGGARAQARRVLAPAERAGAGEGHEVARRGAGFGRLETPGDGRRDAGVVARLDDALQVEGVAEGHAGRAR